MATRPLVVSVEELKQYLRIEHDEEDALIEEMLDSAQTAAEDLCRTEFGDNPDAVPAAIKAAIRMRAGYEYEKRSAPDEKSYNAMRRAFWDLVNPYQDPEKMF